MLPRQLSPLRLILIGAILLCPLMIGAQAQSPPKMKASIVPVGLQVSDGSWVVQVQGGVAVSVAPLPILSPGTPNPPRPWPPNPPSPDLTKRAKEIREVCLSLEDADRVEHAMIVGSALKGIASKVRSMEIPNDNEIIGFALAVAARVGLKESREAWQPVFTKLADHLDEVVIAGGTADDFASCLDDAANGLLSIVPDNYQAETTAPSLKEVYETALEIQSDSELLQIDIAMIIMIAKLIIEILEQILPAI